MAQQGNGDVSESLAGNVRKESLTNSVVDTFNPFKLLDNCEEEHIDQALPVVVGDT